MRYLPTFSFLVETIKTKKLCDHCRFPLLSTPPFFLDESIFELVGTTKTPVSVLFRSNEAAMFGVTLISQEHSYNTRRTELLKEVSSFLPPNLQKKKNIWIVVPGII